MPLVFRSRLSFGPTFRILVIAMILNCFAMAATANDRCPASNAHELSAVKYKLFTAYQTAYDGYQVACEMKCFNKADCTNRCQGEKALQSLQVHFDKELTKRGLSQCSSLSRVCVDQCKEQGESCQKVCES